VNIWVKFGEGDIVVLQGATQRDQHLLSKCSDQERRTSDLANRADQAASQSLNALAQSLGAMVMVH
jgi:hypothetical protein